MAFDGIYKPKYGNCLFKVVGDTVSCGSAAPGAILKATRRATCILTHKAAGLFHEYDEKICWDTGDVWRALSKNADMPFDGTYENKTGHLWTVTGTTAKPDNGEPATFEVTGEATCRRTWTLTGAFESDGMIHWSDGDVWSPISADVQICRLCGKNGTVRCMVCKMVVYCSTTCKKNDSKRHKRECAALASSPKQQVVGHPPMQDSPRPPDGAPP